MKKSKSVVLVVTPVLSTLLLSACGSSSNYDYSSTTRDVYQSREDCLKDWSDGELCEQMNDGDSDDYKRRSGVVTTGRPFWGPQYYPSDRSVVYKGKTVAPTTKTTTMKPFSVTSTSSSSSRSSVSSPSSRSTSSGGFGGRTSTSSSSSS